MKITPALHPFPPLRQKARNWRQIWHVAALLVASTLMAQRKLYTVHGERAGDEFGVAVAFVGDIDKDGYADFVIGATQQITTPSAAGYAKVFSGRTGAPMFKVAGDSLGDFFGASVAGAGDVDKDGTLDILVGSRSTFGLDVKGYARTLSGKDGKVLFTFEGDSKGDQFGTAVAAAGDLDGDGHADLIVGAERGIGTPTAPGYVRIFAGKDGKVRKTLAGNRNGDQFGNAVAGGGDVNKDGVPDIVVGARRDSGNGADAGLVQVFSGKDWQVLYTFSGDSAGDFFGQSVAIAGDVNADGYADIVVGAPWDDNKGDRSGMTRVFSGKDGKVLYSFDGDAARSYFGIAVATAGDLNSDGHADFIVGAVGTSPQLGLARVFSGKDGKVLFEFSGSTAGQQFGTAVAGGGDVDGDGTPDLLVGASTADSRISRSGSAHVYRAAADLPYEAFGVGCGTRIAPHIRAMQAPRIGHGFVFEVRDLPPARLGLLLLGFSNTTWNGTSLPLSMNDFGMPDCRLLVSWDVQAPIWTGSGQLFWAAKIPDLQSLIGLKFYNQCWVFDETANARGIGTSHGGVGVIRE